MAYPDRLERFLDEVFSKWDGLISIKTRLGMRDPDEWERLIRIYNRFPLTELIVHPRLQTDYYKGIPDRTAFGEALAECRHPLCYNGDVFTAADYRRLQEAFPQVERVMLGRGILANPGLLRSFETGELPDKAVLREFVERIRGDYTALFSGEKNILFKMKELWCYLDRLFPDGGKLVKRIKKAERIAEYEAALEDLFREKEIAKQEISFP